MPETVNKDLGKQSEIGQRLFDCFLKERVQSGKVNLWSTMKKRKLLTSKTTAKAVKVTAPDKIVELQEDRSLFASMMMSNLMSILEKVNDNRNNRRVAGPNKDQVKVAIVDGMAKVHSLGKPEWIRNCAQLADHFSNFVMQRYTGKLKPTVQTLGPDKIATLPAFHTLSRANNKGRQGKLLCLKIFAEVDSSIIKCCPCRTWASCSSK
ncbi:unnamed protein product [Porites evermanni]|uniref:Uncharacterized protein n=1 Tax=Porites evermanni TaxID=104178 RepID=A0ABN8LGY2_9CNID|nr:unnamed protein product [Porites evermanni]